MSKTRFVLASAVLALGSATAFAQTATPSADTREAVQEKRIQQGVDSGTLNAPEARRLNRQQGVVDNMQDRAKADGDVSAAERAKIHRAQKRTADNIRDQKHDRNTAR